MWKWPKVRGAQAYLVARRRRLELALDGDEASARPPNYAAMRRQRLILVAVFTRLVIALATQTFFQPDEYFQSLEVAHKLVYGYGHLTWEWLAPAPIRSILYPSLNAPIYYVLKAAGLDGTRLLVGECAPCICDTKELISRRFGGLRPCTAF